MADVCFGQKSAVTRLLFFLLLSLYSLSFLGANSAHAQKTLDLEGVASTSTLNTVKRHFASVLRVNFSRHKGGKALAALDLVSDLRMDRSKVSYALIDLYEKWKIKNGDINLTNIGQIALYLEKMAPSIKKKKKKGFFRGLFIRKEKKTAAMKAEAPPPMIAQELEPAAPPVMAPPVSAPRAVPRPAPAMRSVSRPRRAARTRGFAADDAADDAPKAKPVSTQKAENGYIQTVFYATNRKKTGKDAVEDYFNGKRLRDDKMHYGIAKVNIPFSHKKGMLERPWMGYKSLQNEKQHIFVRTLKDFNEKGFFSAIKAKPSWKGSEKDLLVYVHGFNVDFNEAILRAGQIAFDFGFAGTPIAFSWPSEGEATSYNLDRADALYSAKYLELFLEKLSAKNPKRKIHIIAHSMGNQALLHGLRLMAYKNKKKRFASVILAAPDFDAEFFTQQISKEIRPLAASWTIYTSNKDAALWASENFNSVKRLGTPLSIVDGYQIIDASELQVTPWNLAENHSYYATKKVILDDMVKVLKGLLPADRGLVAVGSAWKPK